MNLDINGLRRHLHGAAWGAPGLGDLRAELNLEENDLGGAHCLGAITIYAIKGYNKWGLECGTSENVMLLADEIAVRRTLQMRKDESEFAFVDGSYKMDLTDECQFNIKADWHFNSPVVGMRSTVETWTVVDEANIVGACTIVYVFQDGSVVPADVRSEYKFCEPVITDFTPQGRRIDFNLTRCDTTGMVLEEAIRIFRAEDLNLLPARVTKPGLAMAA